MGPGYGLTVEPVLFDTNILIDTLNLVAGAEAELGRTDDWAISRISWIEVFAGAPKGARDETEAFLSRFPVVELDEQVARRAALIRAEGPRLKLPDAIILATAQLSGRTLVTRNSKDFPATLPGVRIPYKL